MHCNKDTAILECFDKKCESLYCLDCFLNYHFNNIKSNK